MHYLNSNDYLIDSKHHKNDLGILLQQIQYEAVFMVSGRTGGILHNKSSP